VFQILREKSGRESTGSGLDHSKSSKRFQTSESPGSMNSSRGFLFCETLRSGENPADILPGTPGPMKIGLCFFVCMRECR
jgi:hypothetical protein